jgi:hypothetical protein
MTHDNYMKFNFQDTQSVIGLPMPVCFCMLMGLSVGIFKAQ